MDRLTGVVLCGGESRRMGSDKGLLLKDGRPWALYMADKLSRWKIPVLFSINDRQIDGYGAILPSGGWVVDSQGLAGPLEGLLSVHKKFPERDLLLLACDMLDLDERTISALVDIYRSADSQDFYVYGEMLAGGFLAQPLCGIYTAAGLKTIDRAGAGDLSLQTVLRKGRTFRLSIDDPNVFHNYNE
jgi:molybdenum cofactor guanylyltransferase